jgi:hypothetical protein
MTMVRIGGGARGRRPGPQRGLIPRLRSLCASHNGRDYYPTRPRAAASTRCRDLGDAAFSKTSPLWVSDQGTGVSTVYNLATKTGPLLTVPIPNQGGAPASDTTGPTGQVSTGAPGISTVSTDFQVNGGKAAFIFANLDGSISAWKFGLSQAGIVVPGGTGASYTGLAIGNPSPGAAWIYAADQNSTNVNIYNN